MAVSIAQWDQACKEHGAKSSTELLERIRNTRLSIADRFISILLYEGNVRDLDDDELCHELAQGDAYMQQELNDFLSAL